jgi:heme o synthase
MKPRVMLLAVFTAFVGMMIASVSLDPLLGLAAMGTIAVGASAAGVPNMCYDADIDAIMNRAARHAPRRCRTGSDHGIRKLSFDGPLPSIPAKIFANSLL